jgi:hypothetical protein
VSEASHPEKSTAWTPNFAGMTTRSRVSCIYRQRKGIWQTCIGERESMALSQQQSDMNTEATPVTTSGQPENMSKSMHAGIAVWCDCCSCEMEPYWAEVAREMGVEFSDFED